ncbi:MAG: hypothetical protein GQ570_15050 [Helicobacteraceae bacterium]|nr:hypothetical protein [Helicobacteraceae bacterium]
MSYKKRWRPHYAGLTFAGGGNVANIGGDMIEGGLLQDSKNQALNAKTKALKLDDSRVKLSENMYKDAQLKLDKDDAQLKANRNAKIASTRKFFKDEYKIDTSKMSDEDIYFNSDRLENVYKDKTSRNAPKFFSTPDGIVAGYFDKDGKPVTSLAFKPSSKEDKKFVKERENYIKVDDSKEWNKYEKGINFSDGYYVDKDEYAKREESKKILNDDVK